MYTIHNKIIDIESDESKSFQSYIGGVYEKLKKNSPEILKDLDKIKFGIFATEEALNASVNTKYNPPVLCFSKGLIKDIKTEDEMVAILAHELGHLVVKNKKNKDNKALTDINEERICDIYSYQIMKNASYDTSMLVTSMKKLYEFEKSYFKGSADDIDDHYEKDHPNTLERVRNFEDLIAFDELKGNFEAKEQIKIEKNLLETWASSPRPDGSFSLEAYDEVFANEIVNKDEIKQRSEVNFDPLSPLKPENSGEIDFELIENGKLNEFMKKYEQELAFKTKEGRPSSKWLSFSSKFHKELLKRYEADKEKYTQIIKDLYFKDLGSDWNRSFKHHNFINETLKYKDVFNLEERKDLLFKTKILYKINAINHKDTESIKAFFDFIDVNPNNYKEFDKIFKNVEDFDKSVKSNLSHINTLAWGYILKENNEIDLIKTINDMSKDINKMVKNPYPFYEYVKNNPDKLMEGKDLETISKAFIALNNFKIENYGEIKDINLLDFDEKSDNAFNNALKQALIKEKDKEKIGKISYELLSLSNISSPDLRTILRQKFVIATLKNLGQDDGSVEYSDKFLNLTHNLLENFKYGEGIKAVNQLSEVALIQKDLAFKVKSEIENNLKSHELLNNLALTKVSAFIFDNAAKNKDGQIALLDFLTSPLNGENLKKLNDKINPIMDELYADKLKSSLPEYVDNEALKAIFNKKAKETHENFWHLSNHARTIALSRLIYPVNEAFEDKNITNFLKEKLIPLKNDKGEKVEGASFVRDFFENYQKQCSQPLQRLVFSNLIANIKPKERYDNEQALSNALIMAGPSGAKVLQAINSLSKKDSANNEETKFAKNNFNRPSIFEIWERIDEVMPKEEKDGIKIKDILGSGTYCYTVKISDKDGKDFALTLLKKGIKNEAKVGFCRFEKAFDEMVKLDNQYGNFTPLISHAKELSKLETNLTISAKQSEIASTDYYNGKTYNVDGFDFKITNAKTISYNDKYKKCELAEGKLLNEMDAKSDYTKACAKVVFACEMEQILSGKAIDSDRHGAQLRIDNNGNIKMFDNGALDINPDDLKPNKPTREQLNVLSGIFKKALRNSILRSESVTTSLTKELTNPHPNKNTEKYLNNFKRAIVSLNDAVKLMGENDLERNNALRKCILTALSSETIHPAFKSNFVTFRNMKRTSNNAEIKNLNQTELKINPISAYMKNIYSNRNF
ncbi:MAG: Peptidase family M48 [Alphaproteobacteria bacterium ADurb.Bin438]|nr:MAG: Peptidase family M48 [Alphaproteobacteria bacterium ADurb.Bin438]